MKRLNKNVFKNASCVSDLGSAISLGTSSSQNEHSAQSISKSFLYIIQRLANAFNKILHI